MNKVQRIFALALSIGAIVVGVIGLAGPLLYHFPTSCGTATAVCPVQILEGLEGITTTSQTFKECRDYNETNTGCRIGTSENPNPIVKKHFQCDWNNVSAEISVWPGATITGNTWNNNVTKLEGIGARVQGKVTIDGLPECSKVVE